MRDAPKMTWNPDEETHNSNPLEAAPEKPMLPGRFPSVEKALSGMSGDLQNLKEKQVAAKETRSQLEGSVGEVVHHMNDAVSIKHEIAKKEAQIREEKRKLLGLEREADHIEATHKSLVSSLHRVLEPKLMFAKARFERKEMILQKEQEAIKGWQEKKDKIHAHALELLEAKKVAHEAELAAEEKIAEAKKEAESAHSKYEYARQKTSQEVQSYRYAETRLKAEIAHEKGTEEAASAAKESVEKLGKVLEVESEKVEESMEVNKNQIHDRMRQAEAFRAKTEEEVVELQRKYREWQERQKARASEVIKKAEDTAAASEAYADRQKQVLDTAQGKVVHDAVAKSDWADDSDFSSAGFTDATPSFSD